MLVGAAKFYFWKKKVLFLDQKWFWQLLEALRFHQAGGGAAAYWEINGATRRRSTRPRLTLDVFMCQFTETSWTVTKFQGQKTTRGLFDEVKQKQKTTAKKNKTQNNPNKRIKSLNFSQFNSFPYNFLWLYLMWLQTVVECFQTHHWTSGSGTCWWFTSCFVLPSAVVSSLLQLRAARSSCFSARTKQEPFQITAALIL